MDSKVQSSQNHANRNNKKTDNRHKTTERPLTGELENRQFNQMVKKMYLDGETADVHFVCAGVDGQTEQVPAHKLLLSVASDGFKALFGQGEGDQKEFELGETPAAAFKEFLQFFYMPKIKLCVENIAGVMELSKKYGNDDFLSICCSFLEYRLTTDNIIWGYNLAIRFDRQKMKGNCEQKITETASDVFKSSSFVDCDREMLNQILQLDNLKCDEFQVLIGCLSWAKSSADREGLDTKSTRILRNELGDLLYQIRFRSMTIESFSMFIASYAGFFTSDELEQIIQMIASKDFASDKFNSKFRGTNDRGSDVKHEVMECNRFCEIASSRYYIRKVEKTRFIVSKPVLLIAFDCGKVSTANNERTNVPAKVTITENNEGALKTLMCCDSTLSSDGDQRVTFGVPIMIHKTCKYEIQLEQPTVNEHYNQILFKKEVDLKDGLRVRFLYDANAGYDDAKFGLITKLYLKRA